MIVAVVLVCAAGAADVSGALAAFARNDIREALDAALLVPRGDPDYPVAVAIQATLFRQQGRLRSSVVALRELADGPYGGWATLATADFYRSLDHEGSARDLAASVPRADPWEAQAYAELAVGMQARGVLGAEHALGLPDRADRWFEPRLAGRVAVARAGICAPDAAPRAAAASAELEALEAELVRALALDDAALWDPWTADPAWPHAGLRHLARLDPLTSRAGPDTVGLVRRALRAAADRVALARADGPRVEEALAMWAARCGEEPESRDEWECSELVQRRPTRLWPHRAGDWRYDDADRYWFAVGWRRQRRDELRTLCVDF